MVRQPPVTRSLSRKGQALRTRASNSQNDPGIRERRVRTHRALVLGILLLLLSGCASVKESQLVSLFAPDTPAPTATATAMPTPTATATATPTATPTPTPSPTPLPLEVQVQIDPAVVSEGHTASLTVRVNQSAAVRATVGDTEVMMVTVSDGLYVGLLGVGAIAGAASYPVSVSVIAPDGRTARIDSTLTTIIGDFETEVLVFQPSTEALLAPDIAQPEFERISAIFASSAPAVLWDAPFAWPREDRITSRFGTRRTYGTVLSSYHAGLDIAGLVGEPVVAPASGVVALAEELQVRGNAVIIDHGAGVMSGYFHLSEIAVQSGDQITAGQSIGKVGATGLVTGSHLHWEMRVGGVAVDPVEWLDRQFPWQNNVTGEATPAP